MTVMVMPDSKRPPGFVPDVHPNADGIRQQPTFANEVRVGGIGEMLTLSFFAVPGDLTDLPEVKEQIGLGITKLHVELPVASKVVIHAALVPGLVRILNEALAKIVEDANSRAAGSQGAE